MFVWPLKNVPSLDSNQNSTSEQKTTEKKSPDKPEIYSLYVCLGTRSAAAAATNNINSKIAGNLLMRNESVRMRKNSNNTRLFVDLKVKLTSKLTHTRTYIRSFDMHF